MSTIDKVCPDTTKNSIVYLEFTKNKYSDTHNIIMRCKNKKTNQQVIATMISYDKTEGKWLELSNWEKKLLNIIAKIKKILKVKKIKKIKKYSNLE